MSPYNERLPRVLVCGASFGRVHLKAVSMSDDFELAGLLSRGSEGSRVSAAQYGIPCFTSVDEIPDDIDFACVVIPSATGAGEGTEVAVRLLERGIHVLQEAPLLTEEITRANKVARTSGARYRVNTMHSDLEPVKVFLFAAEAIRKHQQPLFVDAACGVQVLYSLIDMLTRAVGRIRPWCFDDPVTPSAALASLAGSPAPYTSVHGVVGEVPITLRVQNEMDPSDPDNHALLLHRVTIGYEGGVLALADTHGPVLWSPRLYSGRDSEGKLLMGGLERLNQPSTVALSDYTAPRFQSLFDQLWPDAVLSALRDLGGCAVEPWNSVGESRRLQWEIAVSRLWQDVFNRLEPVTLVRRDMPNVLNLSEVMPRDIL